MRGPLLVVACALVGCSSDGPGPRGKGPGTTVTDSGPTTVDTGTPPEPGVPVEVSAGSPVSCDEPSLRLAQPYDRLLAPPEGPKSSWFWGGGAVVADFTGDGRPDIVLPGFHGATFHQQLADGSFVEDGRLDGFDLAMGSGGSAADYDGDGDFDLVITRFLAPDRLLRNDGGLFADVSAEAGFPSVIGRSMATSWADYDGDGDLDLFIGSYGYIDESGTDHANFDPADPGFLLRNLGDGTFEDRSADLPQAVHDGYTFVGSWLDMDRDGLPELYVVNDFGVAFPNLLLHNRGNGLLEPDDGSMGLNQAITAMGLGVGDLNGDGQFDFVMPEWNGIIAVESTELGTWVRTNFARGIYNDITRGQKVGWGAELADLDNDGDLDLPVAFGFLDTEIYDAPQDEPDALFEQAEDGSFTDRGPAWGFDDPTDGRGFVVVDLDGDGWLDMVKRDLQGPTILLKARCGAASWVKIRLAQEGANRHGVGAQVRVWAGGEAQLRALTAGGTGHASGGPPELHFGLSEAETIDRVEVFWPDGAISNLWDLEGRRTLTISRLP